MGKYGNNNHTNRTFQLRKQQWRCWYCGNRINNNLQEAHGPHYATWDHLIPKCLGGTNYPYNRRLVCKFCNHRKDNRTVGEFIELLRLEGTVRIWGDVIENGSREQHDSANP